MKSIKNLLKMFIILGIFFSIASCKKDKTENEEQTAIGGSFSFGGQTYDIVSADYRAGNGDGAWLYFMTKDFHSVQIRFKNLGNYVIPTGTFTYKSGAPYNTATNFAGGFVAINNVVNEISGGVVAISKDGDNYNITINTTGNGVLKGSYSGTLKKI